MDDGLGKGFYWRLIGGIIAIGLGALLCFVLFAGVWARFGGIAAIAVFVGVLVVIAHRYDKKKQRESEELEREYEAYEKK